MVVAAAAAAAAEGVVVVVVAAVVVVLEARVLLVAMALVRAHKMLRHLLLLPTEPATAGICQGYSGYGALPSLAAPPPP